jgi:hypothetical protein
VWGDWAAAVTASAGVGLWCLHVALCTRRTLCGAHCLCLCWLTGCCCFRAGLDPDSEKLLREFDQVVYISCNPQTLAQNLNAVADTHDIERFAVFDQVREGTRHCV